MKKLTRRLSAFLFAALLLFFYPLCVLAAGDGNMDGGSGSMGSGSSTDKWSSQDGVRITVVTTDGSIAAPSFDLSNYNVAGSIIHFGTVSKLQYRSGSSLSPSGGSYVYSKPGTPMPRIVSGGASKASIEAIRRYFCSEYAAKFVAAKAGMSYETLVSGDYKLVIEPIAYFLHGGKNYAMTATEAALYNIKSGGTLRSKLPSLTHQNLPQSLYLEAADLGYPAYSGPVGIKVSDSTIISSLGIGIVTYKEQPEEDLSAPDFEYRVDTDVVTSILLTSTKEVNPKNPASVTFHINGHSYAVTNIVMPAGGSQLVWAKWHTPMEPCEVPITAEVKGAMTAQTSFVAKIVDLDDNPPPDPLATDLYPGYSVPSVPSKPQNTSASWSVWSAYWKAKWIWESDWQWHDRPHSDSCPEGCTATHGEWQDDGEWVDHGNYVFESTLYSASLTGQTLLMPDDIVPTANGKDMKSGYGVKQDAQAVFSCNAPQTHYAPAQTAVSYFPEFLYKDTRPMGYWRLLEGTMGMTSTFRFKENEYSTYNRNVHFTPVWFPDATDYTIYTYVIDAWTPAGMLSINLSDSVTINGSLFDDWHTKRE